MSRDQRLWLYLYFYKPYSKQTLQEGKPACTDLSLKLMMRSQQLGCLTNVNDLIFFYINPIKTKFSRMAEQHILTLLCRNDHYITTTRSIDQTVWFISISIKPIKTQKAQEAGPEYIDLTYH